MEIKINDEVVINADYYRNRSVLSHTLRATVKKIKWNMIQVQFSNGQTEWIDNKHTILVRPHDAVTTETK